MPVEINILENCREGVSGIIYISTYPECAHWLANHGLNE